MINPMAWIEDSSIELLSSVGHATVYEVKQECVIIATPQMTPLYAIPDTHRVVPVKPTPEMIAAALPSAMRESDEDKYRAIGEIICIWDEMLAAHAATASQGGE